jgi:hypothetical protein
MLEVKDKASAFANCIYQRNRNCTTSDFGLGVILCHVELLVAYKQTKNPKPFFL